MYMSTTLLLLLPRILSLSITRVMAASASTSSSTKRVIVLAGPTAVGKSAVAQRLARMLDEKVELVVADSVQIYRGMNIGANKPTKDETDMVKF